MARKISKAEAIEKYENEKKIQQLLKEGKPYKSKRVEGKRKMKEIKHTRFMDMLRLRGGLFKPKKKKSTKRAKENVGNSN